MHPSALLCSVQLGKLKLEVRGRQCVYPLPTWATCCIHKHVTLVVSQPAFALTPSRTAARRGRGEEPRIRQRQRGALTGWLPGCLAASCASQPVHIVVDRAAVPSPVRKKDFRGRERAGPRNERHGCGWRLGTTLSSCRAAKTRPPKILGFDRAAKSSA